MNHFQMDRTQKYIEQHKKYIEQHNNIGRVRAVLRLCGVYPGICPTTEEKHGETSVRVVIHKHRVRIDVIDCLYLQNISNRGFITVFGNLVMTSPFYLTL
jgi:hypothetical protein